MLDENVATKDFESSLAELESLVERMERDELKLEDALHCFEKGISLTRYCQNALAEAELKVENIVNKGNHVSSSDTDEGA